MNSYQLFHGERLAWVTLAGREDKVRAQTTVNVHSKNREILAAVALSSLAGDAFLAVDVGLDTALLAGSHVGDTRTDRHDLNTKLVANDSRVAEKWLVAVECMEISTAHAHGADLHENLTLLGLKLLDLGDLGPLIFFVEHGCLYLEKIRRGRHGHGHMLSEDRILSRIDQCKTNR